MPLMAFMIGGTDATRADAYDDLAQAGLGYGDVFQNELVAIV
jgi:hypothetical protein